MAKFDKERAREVLAPLYEAYRDKTHTYGRVHRDTHAPQRLFVPKKFQWGGVEHRTWLFFATMTDRREESSRVYHSHRELAHHHPELYTPAVMEMEPDRIEGVLMKYKVGSPRQSAQYWPRSAKTFFGDYGGDPIAIYEGRTIDEIVASKHRKKKDGGDRLPGFGPKILSLLAIYLAELEVLDPVPDAFPVDVHVQRFCISTKILDGVGVAYNEEAERILRPALCELVREMGWHALELSHAIWFLGHHVCSGCNRNVNARLLCPSYQKCGGAIASNSYFRKGLWLLDEARYEKGGSRQLALPVDMPLFLSRE